MSLLILGVNASCLRRSETIVNSQFVEATVEDLTKAYGVPRKESVSGSLKNTRVLEYSENLRFQVRGSKVVARFRDPLPQEQTLEYWRNLWKGQTSGYEVIPKSRNTYGEMEYQLVASSLRMGVIYNSSADRVVRIVEYANP